MVKGEGLQVLEERMKTMGPDENEIYKFQELNRLMVSERKQCLKK